MNVKGFLGIPYLAKSPHSGLIHISFINVLVMPSSNFIRPLPQ